jgi:hypothetical protein
MSVKSVLETNDAAKHSIIVGERREDELVYAVIEAPAAGLRFLAELFAAMADESDCDLPLSPIGAGFGWFDERSPKGLFIHRLPCEWGLASEGVQEMSE